MKSLESILKGFKPLKIKEKPKENTPNRVLAITHSVLRDLITVYCENYSRLISIKFCNISNTFILEYSIGPYAPKTYIREIINEEELIDSLKKFNDDIKHYVPF